jgi:hypothetical protein
VPECDGRSWDNGLESERATSAKASGVRANRRATSAVVWRGRGRAGRGGNDSAKGGRGERSGPVRGVAGSTAAIECSRENAWEPEITDRVWRGFVQFGMRSVGEVVAKHADFCSKRVNPPREKQMSFQQAPL